MKTFRASMKQDELQYFWIDALCIDQVNQDEKSAQIPKIADIYIQANRVRIWLGMKTDTSDIAMDFIHELVNLDDIDKLSTSTFNNYKWDYFYDLMRREWFHRRWIIQEIALARNPEVHCGVKSVPWETFTFAVSLFVSKAPQLQWLFKQSREYQFDPDYLGELDALGAKILVDITNRMFRKQDNGDVVEHLLSLEALMSTLTMFEASSPHDTIYATLWLAHDATPGAKRKPAAAYKENTMTPHPSRPQSPVSVQSHVVPGIQVSDAGHLLQSPTKIDIFDGTSGGLLSPQPPVPKAPNNGHESPVARLLKPPDAGRRPRDRSNSLAQKRAEMDSAPEPKSIEVDYKKSVLEVCRDFLQFAISRSRSLDIIARPWAPSSPQGEPMPSWVPPITGRAYELNPSLKVYQRVQADTLVGTPGTGFRPYNASGKKRADRTDPSQPNDFIVGRSLVTKGFLLDVIDRTGDKATVGSIPSSWLDFVGWQDPKKTLPDKFWRTLVADRGIDGHSPPAAYFPLACRWMFGRSAPGRDLDTGKLLVQGICPDLCVTFIRRVQAVIWDRRMILTGGTKDSTGGEVVPPLLALVPRGTQKGDLICILYGCSVPVVLRKRELSTGPSLKRPAEPPKREPRSTLRPDKRQRTSTRSNNHPQDSSRSDSLLGEGQQFASSGSSPPTTIEDSLEPLNHSASRQSVPPPTPPLQTSFPVLNTSRHNGEQVSGDTSAAFEIPLDEQYEFIGECYVHGMMMGEGFKRREDTGNPVKNFYLV